MIVGDVDRAGLPARVIHHLSHALCLRGDPGDLLTDAERREATAEVLGFGRRTMASNWYLAAWLARLDRL